MTRLHLLLLFIPIAIALDQSGANPILVFGCSALALVPLVGLMGDATEALSTYLGPTYGGLLNASLGNAPEIIIGLFALRRGLVGLVKASITGSILGNLLLGLGLSMVVGGLRHGTQAFNVAVAKMNSGLLALAAIGLIIPAVFDATRRGEGKAISPAISCVLFALYAASLVYTVSTREAVIGVDAEAEAESEKTADRDESARWGRGKALGILAAVAVGLAIMSEILTGAIAPASKSIGLTPLFAGVFLLSAAGNVAEIANAVRFAGRGSMDMAIGVTVGASIQVALVVAPILVFAGMAFGRPMDLLFSPHEVASIGLAVFIARNLTTDGESNWLEGLMLLGLYLILGFAFYHLPEAATRR